MNKKAIVLLSLLAVFSCRKKVLDEPSAPVQEGIPELKTFEATALSVFSFTIGGSVINQGDSEIIKAGLVIDTLPAPTTKRNLLYAPKELDQNGEFTTIVTNFRSETRYYIRAFATNTQGTGYGNEVEVMTRPDKVFKSNGIGGVRLTTQQEVIEFGRQNYTTIQGGLFLEDGVKDLSPLKSLVHIQTCIRIQNTRLTDLRGLENVEGVGTVIANGLTVEGNSKLVNFEGLRKLKVLNGDLLVKNNEALETFTGLENLQVVNVGGLIIRNCGKLSTLEGLNNLEAVGDEIVIAHNTSLIDLSELGKLNFVPNWIRIFHNGSLTSLNGMQSIREVNNIEIYQNASLLDLDGLTGLEKAGSLRIEFNTNLENLKGLRNLKELRGLLINENPQLTDLSGLEALRRTIGITISYSDNLESLNGLGLVEVDHIAIEGNYKLESLAGLESIETLESLKVGRNELLEDLYGLEGLERIQPSISLALNIFMNNNLRSLKGLDNLVSIKGQIAISTNPELTDFCVLKPAFSDGFDYTYAVEGNAVNPTIEDIVKNCK